MVYETSGEGSKAWWINLVKDHGPGGMAAIREASGMRPDQVRDALKALTESGHIMPTGKTGAGYKPIYRVKDFGHRHLNEHPEELVGPVKHVVPDPVANNVVQAFDRAKAAAADDVAEDEPDVVEYADATPAAWESPGTRIRMSGRIHYVSEAEARYNREQHEKAAAAAQESAKVDDLGKPGSLASEFRRALFEVLVKKYGRDVSAIEVMAHLERKNAEK
jgi:predicted transcriptional regulator